MNVYGVFELVDFWNFPISKVLFFSYFWFRVVRKELPENLVEGNEVEHRHEWFSFQPKMPHRPGMKNLEQKSVGRENWNNFRQASGSMQWPPLVSDRWIGLNILICSPNPALLTANLLSWLMKPCRFGSTTPNNSTREFRKRTLVVEVPAHDHSTILTCTSFFVRGTTSISKLEVVRRCVSYVLLGFVCLEIVLGVTALRSS